MLQPELLSVSPKDDYKLLLLCENGEKKIFDVSPYISGAWYGELKDLETFKKSKGCKPFRRVGRWPGYRTA